MGLKSLVRRGFRTFGLEVRRKQVQKPCAYLREHQSWLDSLNIRTVLDVGAHAGEFSSMVREVLPQARILAFEPLSEPFQKLVSVMQNAGQFEAFNVALGAASGELTMFQNEYTPSSSLLRLADPHKEAFSYARRETPTLIRVMRLDDVVPTLALSDEIFIKIDAQGYEDKVIAGGEKLIARARLLVVEVSFKALYERQPLFADVFKLLGAYGFKYVGSLDQLRSPIDGSILQADAAFLKM